MLDGRARPLAARLLGPLGAGPLATVPPLLLTAVGLSIGLGASLAAANRWWSLALAGWLLNRFVDGLDGLVARRAGRTSDVGGYLDMCADVVVYAAVPLGVAWGIDRRSVWIAAAFLVASFYVNIVSWSYLAALLEKRAVGARSRGEVTSIAMPRGLIEGTETIVWFSVILIIPGASPWTMGSMAGAVALSAVGHVIAGARLLGADGLLSADVAVAGEDDVNGE
ncbi:MAG: phosphatidylglycerophosphate synthase [Acidimicrobiales bacterium]|jgi:phosphatidylglycerophosphate synthase